MAPQIVLLSYVSRLLILSVLLLPVIVQAQTDHGGTCTGTFAAADNPHRLVRSCVVPAGETLTIAAGVELIGQNNILFVDGVLNSNGATLEDVGLFYRGTSAGVVEANTLRFSANGSTFPIQISNVATPTFRQNQVQGERASLTAFFVGSTAQPLITANTITLSGSSSTAIQVSTTAQPTVTDNTITTSFQGLLYDSSSGGGLAMGNTIGFVAEGASNRRGIVLRQEASPRIEGNTILDDATRSDVGIEVASASTSTAMVVGNSICATGDDRPLTFGAGVFSGVTVADNDLVCGLGAGLGLVANTQVTTAATLRAVQGQQRYTVLGTWTIAAGATLSIPADFTLLGQNNTWFVDGVLNINGATLEDLGLFYRGTSRGLVEASTMSFHANSSTFPIQISGAATPTWRQNQIQSERFSLTALHITGTAQPLITANTITLLGSNSTAIQVTTTAQPTVTDNAITTDFQGILYDGSGGGGLAMGNTIGFVAEGASNRRGIVLRQEASPRIAGNTILDDVTRSDVGIEVASASTSTAMVVDNSICATGDDRPLTLGAGVFSGVTVEDNDLVCGLGAGLALVANAQVTAAATLRTVQGQQRYTVLGTWTIAAGATLSIPADFILLGQNNTWFVDGVLNINSTILEELGLFYRGTGRGIVEASTWRIRDNGSTFPIQINGEATPTLRQNQIQGERASLTAIFISGTAQPRIVANTITLSGSNSTAVQVNAMAQPIVTANTITTNFQGLLYDGSGSGMATGNTIAFVADGANGRRGMVLRQDASPTIANNDIFDDPLRTDVGIEITSSTVSTAIVRDNRICATGDDRPLTLGAGVFSGVTVQNNQFVCGPGSGLALAANVFVDGDATLRPLHGQQLYPLLGTWTVAAGATLTIPAGLTLLGDNRSLNVNGTLQAEGSTFRDVFLSFRGASPSVLRDNTISGPRNSTGLTLFDAALTLSGNLFEDMATVAFVTGTAAVTADANTFRNNNVVFSLNTADVTMTLRDNLFEANTRSLTFANATTFFGAFPAQLDSNTFIGTITANTIVLPFSLDTSGTVPAAPVPYTTNSLMTIAEGITVTMEPGVTIQSPSFGSLAVNGDLVAIGTPERPIIFTAVDPKNGTRWRGLTISNKVPDAVTTLQHCIVEFATTGMTLDNASILIRDCLIADNSTHGIALQNGSAPTLTDNTIVQNLNHGILSQSGSNPAVQGNAIFGNGVNGIQNDDATVVIDARNNFWGHDSGPRDIPNDQRCGTLANPDGLGDEVSDCVEVDPWIRIGPTIAGTLVVRSGSGQSGTAGELLPEPLVIEVRDLEGTPLAGIAVTFSITQGDAAIVEDMPVLTGSTGRARATVRLGLTPGEVRITVTARAVDSPLATFVGEANAPCLFAAQSTGGCPRDGDVNDDGRLTPGDAYLVFLQALGSIDPPMAACLQARADVASPPPGANREITPADALCIFQSYLGQPSCLEGQSVLAP